MRLSELKPEEPGQPWGDVCRSHREVPHWRQCVGLQAPHELACKEPSGLAQEIPEARLTRHLVLFPGAAVSKHTDGGFNARLCPLLVLEAGNLDSSCPGLCSP